MVSPRSPLSRFDVDPYAIEKLNNAKPDLSVLRDYKKREEEFLRRAKDLERITEARDAQKQEYDNLRKQRLDEFMAGFSLISLKLKEMYQVRVLISFLRENVCNSFRFSAGIR